MDYQNGDTCPVCGRGSLVNIFLDEEFEHRGHKLTITNFKVYGCDFCESELVSESTMKEHGQTIRDFHELVNKMKAESAERREQWKP